MSGWDAPSWDPPGGAGENTQSFSVPDFPDDGGGFPGSSSPGTPPAIFLQDYDQNEVIQDDFGRTDLGQAEYGRNNMPSNGFGRDAHDAHDARHARDARHDHDLRDDSRRSGFAVDDFERDDFGQRGYGQRGPAPQDYSRPDYQRQDHQRQDHQWQGPSGGDQASGDYPGAGHVDPRGQEDADYAARMDPALRDFFAPQSGRQPSGLREAPPSRWDTPAPRSGSRSGHRQDAARTGRDGGRGGRGGGGGRSTAGIVVAVVLVLGIAVGAYLLLRGKPAAPAAQNGAGSTPSSSTQATTSPRAAATGRSATRYTLKTPAKAGGYTKLSSVPTAVQAAAGVTSAAIKDAATKDGGKVSKQVMAAYQMSGGQVLAFTGFTGTFNPAKVMTSLATLGTDSNIAAAGRHGGMLACATAPGSGGVSKGTVCVWVTKTTLGVTEFFGTDGPETVTDRSKAAADALKVRDDVEVSKS